MLMSLCINITW